MVFTAACTAEVCVGRCFIHCCARYLVIYPVPIYSSSAPSFTYDNNTILFLYYNPVHRYIFELKYSAAMTFSPCWRNCESQYCFQYNKLKSGLRN